MRYIRSNLLHGEKIIHETRPHWIIFGFPIVIVLLALGVYEYLKTLLGFGLILFGTPLYQWAGLALFLTVVYLGIKAYIMHQTSEYGITDKRIVMKAGWIQRRSIEIFLEKVESIYVDQTVIGRICNYGTIIIVGTGGSKDPFLHVPSPLLFRNRVEQQIDNMEEKRHEHV